MSLDEKRKLKINKVKGSKIRGSIKCSVVRKIKIKKQTKKLNKFNLICLKIRNIIVAITSLKKKERSYLFRKILPLSSNISALPQKKFYEKNKINIDDINEISLNEVLDKKISEN